MAKRINIHPDNPNRREILQVVDCLKKGGIIIYPTDSVYALGCDIMHQKAMEKLAQIRKTTLKKAKFSIVCKDLSHLSEYAKQTDRNTYKLLNSIFPGPYTAILEATKKLPNAYKDHKTVGIRVPSHSVPNSIVSELGNPIVSTSIHDHNEENPLEYLHQPDEIWDKYKNQIDVFLDCGLGGQIPSTIIDLSSIPFTIVRIGKGDISEFLVEE